MQGVQVNGNKDGGVKGVCGGDVVEQRAEQRSVGNNGQNLLEIEEGNVRVGANHGGRQIEMWPTRP